MIEVGQRAFNVHPIRSNVTAIEIGLRDVVIVGGQVWRQVGGRFVIGDRAVQVSRGAFSLASIQISVSELRVQTNRAVVRSEEHTSELQSRRDLVCRLL